MAAAWKATFRSPRRPSRALGCHNADFFRQGWRAGAVQRPRMLTAFCWKAQIGGTAEEPRDILREHIQHFVRCLATREPLQISWKNRKIPIPPCRKVAALHQFDLIREIGKLFAVSREQLRPLCSGVLAALPMPSLKWS